MLKIIMVVLLAGCQSGQKINIYQEPKPSIPSTQEKNKGQEEYDAAGRLFTDEVDACFVVYRDCRKSAPDSVCFPPHEKCVVVSYRKFKKAKEKYDATKSLLRQQTPTSGRAIFK